MAGLELRYASIEGCIYGIQKLPVSYPEAERVLVRGEGQYVTELERTADIYGSFYAAAEMLTEDTSRCLDSIIREFQKFDSLCSFI